MRRDTRYSAAAALTSSGVASSRAPSLLVTPDPVDGAAAEEVVELSEGGVSGPGQTAPACIGHAPTPSERTTSSSSRRSTTESAGQPSTSAARSTASDIAQSSHGSQPCCCRLD